MKQFLVALTFLVVGFMQAQTYEERSMAFIKNLEQGQYDACYAEMDTAITNHFGVEDLKTVWESMPGTFGDYKSHGAARKDKVEGLDRVIINCQFERSSLDMNLIYAASGKMVGFRFTPAKSMMTYNPPDYFDPSKYYESNVTVKTGKYSLDGILTLPNNISNPPVVILLAGSGPNDKDESIGPNKPLKDIAIGLAAQGIASLRYDKRTKTYGAEMAQHLDQLGIEEEVILDALSAIALVKQQASTKHSKIFVAGHSLGAMCAPIIASRSKDLQGIILLAGNARPLEDLLIEQYTYLLGLDSLSAEDHVILDTLKAQVQRVKNPELLKKASAKDLPLGLPAHYWQSLKKYDQLTIAQSLKLPMLVLQGKRDYQVTLADFDLWEQHLNAHPKTEFTAYEGLNHLFIEGEGICKPAEYQVPGHVKEKVILDMAAWIKNVGK